MKNLEPSNHENNVYAYDSSTREEKHISEVESGKKGYTCMGCGFEMIAKKGQIHQHHFAHAPRTFEQKQVCTFSDETYRHKLAKEILQRIRRIKVPASYIFSDDKSSALKVEEARTIVASSVKNELQFYEDEEGIIQYGRGVSFSDSIDKELLIQPDVTFFDVSGNPVLLIELVATHKVTPEKLVKIQRLGIDTVEVSVPKSSPGDIEKIFSVTSNTQWIYNHEREEKQIQLSVPSPTQAGIPPDAEHQKSILRRTETFVCRKAHLKDLIRGLRKSLGSEQFRSTQRRVNSKLSDVKRQTEELDRQVGRHRKECLRKHQQANQEPLYELHKRRGRVETLRRKEIKRYRELEERYLAKDEELRREQEGIEEEQDKLRIAQELYRSGNSSRVGELRAQLERVRGNPKSDKELEADFESEKRRVEKSIGALRRDIGREEINLENSAKEPDDYRQRAEAELAERVRKESEEVAKSERGIRRKFEERNRRVVEGIQGETFEGISKLKSRYFGKTGYRQLLLDIAESSSELERYRTLKEFFDSRAWKK